jgi:hypothetical protein
MTAWMSYAAFDTFFVVLIGCIWMPNAWRWCTSEPEPWSKAIKLT